MIPALEWERQKTELRGMIREELAAAMCETRWVTNAQYRKYHNICPATLWKLQSALKRRNAMRGSGKSARFDKFFDPTPFMGRQK